MSSPLRFPLSLRFALGVVLILALSLSLFYWIMHPPMGDLELMARFLSITALVSTLAGFAAYRLGWIERSPSLRFTPDQGSRFCFTLPRHSLPDE